jgi:trans-2,3-dihydro-3-hydroxyanthranilate isomerase
MLCVENNQLIEDAATGSARVCRFSLKNIARHSNYQSPGEYINRPSQIYFDGK